MNAPDPNNAKSYTPKPHDSLNPIWCPEKICAVLTPKSYSSFHFPNLTKSVDFPSKVTVQLPSSAPLNPKPATTRCLGRDDWLGFAELKSE